ncbi:hypothetical protein K7W03_27435, partial [Sphingobium sp. PNB]|uniref:hypothetical protein n=1 Tax=Sphingobium sp. PNB TaxID=863934 RepID=UPI001CA42606
RRKLPRLRQTRQHHAMAQMIKSSLLPRAFSKQMESSADLENATKQKLRAVEPMQSDRNLL